MKKIVFFLLSVCQLQEANAQTTSSTFDPIFAAKMQAVIDKTVANGEVKGVSIAITFPGQGTFIGVGGISKEGVPITPDMQFGVGSNSKLFTAVLVMKLQELGKLSLNDPISAWLPNHQYIDPAITIRQLLNHQSGIFDFETEIDPHENFYENMNRFVYGPDVFYTPQDVLALIGPPHFSRGEKYLYSNTNYLLAAMIVEAASGKSFAENLHQYIFDPLELNHTFLAAYESPNGTVAHAWHLGDNIGNTPTKAPHSMYLGSGSIFSTASDMIKWYEKLFAGNVISQTSLDELRNFEPSSEYGMGLQLNSWNVFPNDDIYVHGGWVPGYTSDMGYDIKKGSIQCAMANDEHDFNVLLPILSIIYDDYPSLQNDAGIKKIISPSTQKCGAAITPQVILKNSGLANLASVTIKYQIDAGIVTTFLWTGNLLPDNEVIVSLPSTTAGSGSHSFRCFTENPNGNADGYSFNNEATAGFNINTSALPTIINEDFEGTFPPPGWVVENKTVTDWKKCRLSLLTGTGAVVKNNWYDASGNTYDLELPALNLSSATNPVLSFNYAYRFIEHGHADGLSVLVSSDCGQTYQSAFNKSGQSLKTTTRDFIPNGYLDIFFPDDNEWGQRTINLSAYKNENVIIKFRAINANGDNLYLDNVKVSDETVQCATPTDLNELQITSSTAKLNWKFQGNANHFEVYYRPRGTATWSQKNVAGNKQWTNISGLLPETDYEWYIIVTCNSSSSIASPISFFSTETLSVQTTKSLQIEESKIPGTNNFRVAPNPAMSAAEILFSVSQQGKITFELYDLSGRLITTVVNKNYAEGSYTLNLDIRKLNAGIYVLRMQTGSSIETKKLVVIK